MRKKTRKRYTQEFKEEAVKLITNQGYSFAEAGRNLGVNPNLLSRWKKRGKGVKSALDLLINYDSNGTLWHALFA